MKNRSVRRVALPILGAAVLFSATASAGEVDAALSEDLGDVVRRALSEADFDAIWQVGTPFEGVEAALQAPNREHELRTYFLEEGVQLGPRVGGASWTLSMSFAGFERGTLEMPASPAEVVRTAERVEYRRGPVTEWYMNDARGLEQGFDLNTRPLPLASGQPLELLLEFGGSLELASCEADSLRLRSHDESTELCVAGLFAFDASGRDLPSHFERREGGLAIVVDDSDAQYPITIDPTVTNESAKLQVAGGVDGSTFGGSVDIEGTWAIVGAPGNAYSAGSAYIFQHSGSTWNLQAKLVSAGLQPGALFGADVAITGTHAVIGAPGRDGALAGSGAVFSYRNIGGAWTASQMLIHETPEIDGQFGYSVDIGPGYLMVGAPNHDTLYGVDTGDVEGYVISNGIWDASPVVYEPVIATGDRFGVSVDFHGTRFAAGASGNGGAVYPYLFNAQNLFFFSLGALTNASTTDLGYSVSLGEDWLISGSPASNGTGSALGAAIMWAFDGEHYYNEEFITWGLHSGDRLGNSVAISESLGGEVHALIGIPNDDLLANNGGAVRAFDHEGTGSWIYRGVARPTTNSNSARFGSSLAAYGDIALAGAPFAGTPGNMSGSVSELSYSGTSWSESEGLAGHDQDPGDELGYSVDIEGDLAAVGAPGDSDVILNGGSVYLFERTNGIWSQSARLTSTVDARENGRFGAAVDIAADGQTILIGAPREDSNSNLGGAAYVFERSGQSWTQDTRLEPWSTSGIADFGASLALAGDLAVVGAPLADGNTNTSGAAYLFRRVSLTWINEEKLEHQNGSTADGFGRGVYTDGTQVMIGAPGSDSFTPEGGAMYIFEELGANWDLVQTMTGINTTGELGYALAGSGELLAVSAPADNSNAGRVYVLKRDVDGDWSHHVQLEASDAEFGDRFGEVLSMDAGRVLVGAPGEDVTGQQSGAAYLYEEWLGSWEGTKLVASDEAAGDELGSSVALSGDTTFVGSPYHDAGAQDAGAAYTFEVSAHPTGPVVSYGEGDGSNGPCPCGNESEAGQGEGCSNSSGLGGARLSAMGSTSVNADDLALHVTHLLPGQPALLISGNQALGGLHFGDGLRMVGTNVVRLQVAVPSAQGEADFGPGLANQGGWQAGDVRYLQAWYRDPVSSPCLSGFNLSNGLQVSFGQ